MAQHVTARTPGRSCSLLFALSGLLLDSRLLAARILSTGGRGREGGRTSLVQGQIQELTTQKADPPNDLRKREELDEDRLSALDDQLEELDEKRRSVFADLRLIRKRIRRAAPITGAPGRGEQADAQLSPEPAQETGQGTVPPATSNKASARAAEVESSYATEESGISNTGASSTPTGNQESRRPEVAAPFLPTAQPPTSVGEAYARSRELAQAAAANQAVVHLHQQEAARAAAEEERLEAENKRAEAQARAEAEAQANARRAEEAAEAAQRSRALAEEQARARLAAPQEDPDNAFRQYMREEDGEDEMTNPEYQESAAALSRSTGWQQDTIEGKANDAVRSLTNAIGGKKVVRSLQGMLAGLGR
ncbi:unnamed protein product [Amoebophrya sp. A120]|nr:unnamed protein product [Amoebophrya sp. A120]|eukprot:GSA120T00020774001.1